MDIEPVMKRQVYSKTVPDITHFLKVAKGPKLVRPRNTSNVYSSTDTTTVTTKYYDRNWVENVEDNGLPVTIGPITVCDLGTVEYTRRKFWTKRYILPIGYKTTRTYASMLSTNRRCLYSSEIVDGGSGPIFRVTCSDKMNEPVDSATSSGAWSEVVRRINNYTGQSRSALSVSGPELYGYANPNIWKLIQDLPDVEKCIGYKKIHFSPT